MAPVAAAPVPTAVETVGKESLGVLLLLFSCCWADTWIWSKGKKTQIIDRDVIAMTTIILLLFV